MRCIASFTFGLAISTSFLLGQANAASSKGVPLNMRGVWGKHGRCDVAAQRLTISARTVGWVNGPLAAVEYDPHDKVIFWAEEGNVDNFVIGRTPDILVHNTQGFDMPGGEGYLRCGPTMARVSWPPK